MNKKKTDDLDLEEIIAKRKPTGKEKSILDRIERDRFSLNEIMITAVIFGLTLNLISDFLSNAPSNFENLDALVWSGILAGGSVLATAYIFIRMIRNYLSDDCIIKTEFEVRLFWDRSSGEGINLGIMGPQFQFHSFTAFPEIEYVNELKDELKTLDFTEGVPESLLLKLFERILFNKLAEWGPFAAIQEKEYNFQQVQGLANPLISDTSQTAIYIPGDVIISYSFNDKNGQLEIIWTNDYQGRITLKFHSYVQMVPIVWEKIGEISIPIANINFPISSSSDEGFFAANFRVSLEAEFSPLNLHFRRKHVQELITWTNIRFNWLRNSLDWNANIQSLRNAAESFKDFEGVPSIPESVMKAYELSKEQYKKQKITDDKKEKSDREEKTKKKKQTKKPKKNDSS